MTADNYPKTDRFHAGLINGNKSVDVHDTSTGDLIANLPDPAVADALADVLNRLDWAFRMTHDEVVDVVRLLEELGI
jgi:hypothetical protein